MPLSMPVCLVGMPGAGKSVTGQEIAKRLGVPFFDADTEIEIAANMSICELFAKYGEDTFRQGECRVMKRLLSDKPCVVATGGGAFINDTTRQVIQAAATSVYLHIPLSILWQRVREKAHRPLLAKPNSQHILQQMYATRTPIYQHAHINVSYHNEDIAENADRITQQILTYMKKHHDTP